MGEKERWEERKGGGRKGKEKEKGKKMNTNRFKYM